MRILRKVLTYKPARLGALLNLPVIDEGYTLIGNKVIKDSNQDTLGTTNEASILNITTSAETQAVVNGSFTTGRIHYNYGNHTSSVISNDAERGSVLEVVATGVGDGNNRCLWDSGTGLIGSLNTYSTKYIRISFYAKSISGNVSLMIDDSAVGAKNGAKWTITTSWDYYSIVYKKGASGGALMAYISGAGTFRLDNLSVAVLNWNGATEIYDTIYAATTGAASVKELAACKAAAMWSYHPASSSFGKLYNEYAKRLAVIDIDTAKTFGYHILTEDELTDISTYGGNALKTAGTTDWETALGTNTTKFKAKGISSARNSDGSYATTKETTKIWSADSAKSLLLHHDSNVAEIVAAAATEGNHIRFANDYNNWFHRYYVSNNEVVFKNPTSDIRVLFVSDIHLGQPSIDQPGQTSEQRIQFMVNQLNAEHVISPVSFVIFNGDICEYDSSAYTFYKRYNFLCQKLKMPFFVNTGNHELITDTVWNTLFPYTKNYSIRFGDKYFVMFNNYDGAVMDIITNYINVSDNIIDSLLAKYINGYLFAASHYGRNDTNLLDKLAAKSNMKAMFDGHTHLIDVTTVRGVVCCADGHFSVPPDGDWSGHQGWSFRELLSVNNVLTSSIVMVPYVYQSHTQTRDVINTITI